jgi:hypothetical protein
VWGELDPGRGGSGREAVVKADQSHVLSSRGIGEVRPGSELAPRPTRY